MIIDDEFSRIIHPLDSEEYRLLSESIIRDGCYDPLVVWREHNILLDGHNRYKVCTDNNIPFATVSLSFKSRIDAKLWILRHQLGRRNLTQAARVEMVMKIDAMVRERSKSRQADAGRMYGKNHPKQEVVENFPQPITGVDSRSRDTLARLAGVSERTYDKASYVLRNADEVIRGMYRSGDISADRAYRMVRVMERATPAVAEIVSENRIDDPETVDMLIRLEKSNRSSDSFNTFDAIRATGYIQPGDEDEAVHIAGSPVLVKQALESIARQHRFLATASIDKHPALRVKLANGEIVESEELYGWSGELNDKIERALAEFGANVIRASRRY
jgi:hypothetical protein